MRGSAGGADSILGEDGADSITLTDRRCYREITPHISSEVRGMWRAADAVLAGRRWKACWARGGGSSLIVLYSDGDYSVRDMSEFTVR